MCGVAGFSLSVPVGLSVGVRVVVVRWWVSVWVGVRLSVCRPVGVFVCLSLLFVVVWASGRAAGSSLSRPLTS